MLGSSRFPGFRRYLGWFAVVLTGLAVVPADAGLVYYAVREDNTIYRADEDGGNVQAVLTHLDEPMALTYEPDTQKLYFSQTGDTVKAICRCDLDGSDVEYLVTPNDTDLGHVFAIAFDTASDQMYWTESLENRIRRATLNGADIETLRRVEHGIDHPRGIDLDLAAGKMYWTERDDQELCRSDLNGLFMETIVGSNIWLPGDVALDASAGKMYWAQYGELADAVYRADLDGGNRETVALGAGAFGLSIDPAADKLYWTSYVHDKVERSNLDGTDRETLVYYPDDSRLGGIAYVPEPATMALLALGGSALLRRRRAV